MARLVLTNEAGQKRIIEDPSINKVAIETAQLSGFTNVAEGAIPEFGKMGGIKLPDQPDLPDTTGEEITGISASLPAVDEEDIRKQTEEQFAPGKGLIESRFGRRISEAIGLGKEETRALEGQLGTRRRFSTSAKAFIDFIDDKNKKEITKLEEQREEALTTFDFELAELVDSRIARKKAEAQQQFNNIITLLQLSEKPETEKADTVQARSNKDAAVLAAMGEGLSSVSDIFNNVKGKIKDITLEDVTSALESLGGSIGVDSDAASKFIGDTKNFFLLKAENPEFIPGEILALPENEQLGAYISWVENDGKFKGVGGDGSLSDSPFGENFADQALGIRIARAMFGSGRALSDQDREIGFSLAEAGQKEGISEIEMLKRGLGYNIERNLPLADNLFKMLIANSEEGMSSMDLLGLAHLINTGKEGQAILKAEATAYKAAKELDPEAFTSEPAVRIATRQVNDLVTFFGDHNMLTEIEGEDGVELEGIGAFSGSMQKFITRRFRGQEEAVVLTRVKNLVKDMVKEMAGVNITADELRFIEDLIPGIDEPANNFMFKLNQLKSIPLLKLNEIRDDRTMPKVNEKQLFDRSLRTSLYSGGPQIDQEDFFNNPVPGATDKYDASVWDEIET